MQSALCTIPVLSSHLVLDKHLVQLYWKRFFRPHSDQPPQDENQDETRMNQDEINTNAAAGAAASAAALVFTFSLALVISMAAAAPAAPAFVLISSWFLIGF